MNKVRKMLEDLEKEFRANKQYSAADKLLPIIQEARKAGWILCSERLPEKNNLIDKYYVRVIDDKEPSLAYWFNGMWLDEDCFLLEDVVAWMSLPEPYKGE